MPSTCRFCERPVEPFPDTFNLCVHCASELGVMPMPPPRRPPRPCQRCSATRLVRAIPREYTASGNDFSPQRVAPMMLTASPTAAAPPNIAFHGHGLLETYTCLGCGFVEWYCLNPERIPIGPEYMTELFDCTPGAPYR
jgi:hypothetical protein